MLAFPVAKLENVRTSHQRAIIPFVSPNSAPADLPVMSAQRYLKSSFNRAVLTLQSAEFNRQIRKLDCPVTYRKHTAAIRSNRQKIQKSAREFSPLLCLSESGGPVHSLRGQS
jgi:hypothetical protein